MPPDLRQTLVMTATAMASARDPWWIIGSAAVALHGAVSVTVADVDVLASEADAARLFATLGIAPSPGAPDPLFRSQLFGQWTAPPLAVEIMAGLAVPPNWRTVTFATRLPIAIDGRIVYIPAVEELAALLRRFGRPKDHAREALLHALPNPR